jgi:hypothetical protein
MMHHVQGTQLAELGKESADSYRQINDGVQLLRDWVKHTLGLVKPVVIQKPDQEKGL